MVFVSKIRKNLCPQRLLAGCLLKPDIGLPAAISPQAWWAGRERALFTFVSSGLWGVRNISPSLSQGVTCQAYRLAVQGGVFSLWGAEDSDL